jgi:prepilin-type N-terminal cleavage/methylation domain-containing protein
MNKLIKQAFTLIELLVVIAIIGILSGLIVVSMSGVTQKANIAKAQVFSNSLRNSLMVNIVGEWKFDGVTTERAALNTDLIDTWGGVNNGSIGGAPVIKVGSNCVSGSCFYSDGDDYIGGFTESNFDFNDSFTLAAWLNIAEEAVGYTKGAIAKNTGAGNSGFMLGEYSGSWSFFVNGVNIIGSSNWSLNTWHYVVGVYNKTEGKIYLYADGMSISAPALATNVNNNDDLTIGKWIRDADSRRYWKGLIDDVRIYSAAMSTSQIKEQYYVGLNNMLNNGSISKEDYLTLNYEMQNLSKNI